MKRLFLSIFLVAFAIFIAFVEVWYINYAADDTIDDISRINEFIESTQNDKALKNAEKVIEKWNEKSMIFNIFLIHEEIEAIAENLEELKAAIETEDNDRFYEVSAKIKRRLNIIKEDEIPLLENVL